MGTSIVITSGKGGTGKTTCTGAIGAALAMLGRRTLCIDCDIGLKNLDIILGLTDSSLWDFSDVLSGAADLNKAVISHPRIENLYFLSAPANPSPDGIDAERFIELISSLKEEYEFVLIDSPAGVGSGFQLACSAADMAIIVANPDASSLRDGQKTCALIESMGIDNIRLIVNRVNPKLLRKMSKNVDDIIDAVGAQLIGVISEDKSVPLSAEKEQPLILYGAKYAYDQFYRVARRLTGEDVRLSKI